MNSVKYAQLLMIHIDDDYVFDISEGTIDWLLRNLFIKRVDDGKYALRAKGYLALQKQLPNVIKKTNLSENVNLVELNSKISYALTNIELYRDLFLGLKPGSMGSLKNCKLKLTRWISENPEYSFDDILKATKNYINSLDNFRYLRQADYFIYKLEKNGEESSTLSAFIDELKVNSSDSDWTSNIL